MVKPNKAVVSVLNCEISCVKATVKGTDAIVMVSSLATEFKRFGAKSNVESPEPSESISAVAIYTFEWPLNLNKSPAFITLGVVTGSPSMFTWFAPTDTAPLTTGDAEETPWEVLITGGT